MTGRILLSLAVLLAAGVQPARAQAEIAGEWSGRLHEEFMTRNPGPHIGDFTGVPLNAAARFGADTWESSIVSLIEHQSQLYTSFLGFYAPGNARISKITDERTQATVAYRVQFAIRGLVERTIWMDGRPHPPAYAAHTWAGFSTGRWDGRMLRVDTTHLKAGYSTRNGVRHTDRATMVEYFVRHGNYLTVVVILDDPASLEEPFIQSWCLALNPDQRLPGASEISSFSEVAGHARGHVPHYLPGRNPYLKEFSELTGLPLDATRGGRETMYPEYRLKLKDVRTKALPSPPRP